MRPARGACEGTVGLMLLRWFASGEVGWWGESNRGGIFGLVRA